SIAADDLGVLRESSEEPVEDVLRKQLLDKDRENDKVTTPLPSDALQAQLAQRPSIENCSSKARNENERCMAEIDRIKTLAGENWQSVLDITPSSTSSARMGMGTYLHRGQLPSTTESSGQSASPTPMSVEATRAQFDRMQEREEKLNETIERAETQEMKCEALRQEALPSRLSA
ncbi:hypothetical protein BKA82DRAFT_4098905, partial [Pisolithus tinctorius]